MGYRRDYAAVVAWLKARMDKDNAHFWLLRASLLLSSQSPRIELELAHLRLTAGDIALAAKGFAKIADRYDNVDAYIGLSVALARLGDMKRAAAAVESVLTRHHLPSEAGFAALAGHLARETGYDGYRGVAADWQVVQVGQGRLLGAKSDWVALNKLEGIVAWQGADLSGSVARPAAPGVRPELWLTDAKGVRQSILCGELLPPGPSSPLVPRFKIAIAGQALANLTPPFSVGASNGPELAGSPLYPVTLTMPSTRAAYYGEVRRILPKPRKLAVVMPVYNDLAQTKAAITSVMKAIPATAKLVVVDDCTPEPALARYLDKLAAEGRLTLLRHTQNRGFCVAVNTGLNVVGRCDVLLLNADILLPQGVVETLVEVAYAHAATGTVSPFSNEASIMSYPAKWGGNPIPDMRETGQLNMLARRANGAAFVEIPSTVGFCMFIRHDCLEAVGGFRNEIFAQGYGEENDFCIRARHLGFRHMAAPGAYVAHKGGASFGATANELLARNLRLVEQLFPGYQKLVDDFMRADPLATYRAAFDEMRLRTQVPQRETVLLITDADSGSDARRRFESETKEWKEQGKHLLLLKPKYIEMTPRVSHPTLYALVDSEGHNFSEDNNFFESNKFCNLVFKIPTELPRLLKLLETLRVTRVVFHQSRDHHKSMRTLAGVLGVTQDTIIYDYSSFCPRMTLLNRPVEAGKLRYCGEPALKSCEECCSLKDDVIMKQISVSGLRKRSFKELNTSDRVIVPSRDTAQRLKRHFPSIVPHIRPWMDQTCLLPPSLVPANSRRSRVRVAVLHDCNPATGMDVLLDCAADASQRSLPLDFFVIGSSTDDEELLEAGIFVTSSPNDGNIQEVIRELSPDLAFVPSIWPETWCFALDEAWKAGLNAFVFNLGAQAERMHASRRGVALPLGLPVQHINNILIQAGRGVWPSSS